MFGHKSCHKTKPASLLSGCNTVLFLGRDINTFLQSFGKGFGVDSRDGMCSIGRRLIDHLHDFFILQGYDFQLKLFGILNTIGSDGV